jgi:hypothetical protein
MNLPINVAAVSDVIDYDRSHPIVDLVKNSVVPRPDAPTFAAGKFLEANGSGIFVEGFYFIFYCDHFLTR